MEEAAPGCRRVHVREKAQLAAVSELQGRLQVGRPS